MYLIRVERKFGNHFKERIGCLFYAILVDIQCDSVSK
jgi:hypothetical protein